MRINSFAISNIGNVRENHEDNFFVPKNSFIDIEKQKQINSPEITIEESYSGDSGIFVVSDGMGGHNAGEVASRIAVEFVSNNYNKILTHDENTLLNFIKELNNYICDYSDKNADCSNMGTTFSSLIFENDKLTMLHVGDSRVYRYSDNKLIQLSKDHTEGVRLLEAGVIKKEDLEKFPNRKSLYKYLGRKGELVGDVANIDFSKGDKFIVSSDGLVDTLSNDEILDVLLRFNDLKDICFNLNKECLKKGKVCSDNVTIISIEIN